MRSIRIGPRRRPVVEGVIHDPEFDVPRRPPRVVLESQLAAHQRLVANPFLAFLALIVWVMGIHFAYSSKDLPILIMFLLGLIGIGLLFQYHCLDCGSTGNLLRWRRHACERVIARQESGRVRRFRGPNPAIQTLLWSYMAILAAIFAAVTAVFSP
ncbi:hypothetical protein ACYOEI_04980 [Singulisphaera rosea]